MTVKNKAILRNLIVLVFILGTGFLGLWFLGKPGDKLSIKNPESGNSGAASQNTTVSDQFSDFGGKTPQETISLLVTSLEKNNVTLATKYFVPEAREVESEDLLKLKNANILSDLIKDLKNLKNGKKIDDTHYSFEVFDEAGQAAAEINLSKNGNGFWKLISL